MLEKDIRRSNEVSNKLKQIKYLEDKVFLNVECVQNQHMGLV